MPENERPAILLVEDSEQTAALVIAILQNEFQVETAGGGIGALDLMRTRDYSAILLDLRMPELDGYEVLARVLEIRPELLSRIVVFTAALSRNEIERVKQFAVWGTVRKPFDVETLRSAVRSCAHPNGDGPSGGLIAGGVVLLLGAFLP